MPRILVTAAMGNVGRETVRECATRGFVVRVAARIPAKLGEHFPQHEAAKLDFLDRATWLSALDGCDQVFLLRPPSIANMEATLIPFVEAAYGAGVRHIVFVSVAGADRMKWFPHRKVELALLAKGKGFTLLRPGFFAQNLQDAYRRDIVEEARIYVPAGAGRVAFLDVRDIGAVAARVFEEPTAYQGRSLTLTGPEALSFDQVAGLLSTALHRAIRYEPASILGYAVHLRRRRALPWTQAIIQTVLHVGLRRGDADHVEDTIEQVLGRPPLALRDYIERSVDTWCALQESNLRPLAPEANALSS